MSNISKHFYKDRVALNVLANSVQNAKEIYQAAEQNVLVGLLSKNYPNTEAAVSSMLEYDSQIDGAVSIGLGAGDSKQAQAVTDIASSYSGAHINQVFPHVGRTRSAAKDKDVWINSLVKPTGKVGYVNIATGPTSEAAGDEAIIPVKSAISIVKDMGGQALKFFPMHGLDCKEEYEAVAKACGEENFALEPTGGIDTTNFHDILKIALDANVPKVIPHVYSSIINKETKETKIDDVRYLFGQIKELVDHYE